MSPPVRYAQLIIPHADGTLDIAIELLSPEQTDMQIQDLRSGRSPLYIHITLEPNGTAEATFETELGKAN